MKKFDVKEIFEIPNIENFTHDEFELDCYNIGDQTQHYIYYVEDSIILIDIISEEKLILRNESLSNLITQDSIHFFQWSIGKADDSQSREVYSYRPLIDDKEKVFYKE